MFGTSDTAGARILSSLSLQILLHFNQIYLPLQWLCLLSLLIYKGTSFPYPPTAYPLELFTLLPFLIIETTRLFLGTRGNKLEHKPSILIFLGLTIATVFLHLFYCIWQTYVTMLDVVVAGIGLTMVVGEIVTGVVEVVALAQS